MAAALGQRPLTYYALSEFPKPTIGSVDGLSLVRYRPESNDSRSSGPALVIFCHGVMDRAAGFRRVARSLPMFDVICYDRRGYADSYGSTPFQTLAHSADDLRSVIEFGLDGSQLADRKLLLVGHSQGGLIAARALLDLQREFSDNDLSAVAAVLWEPPMPWEPWYASSVGSSVLDLDPAAAAHRFLEAVLGPRLWSRVPQAQRTLRERDGEALLADLRMSRRQEANLPLEEIRCAVVAGFGSESGTHNKRTAAEYARRCPNAELVEIPGADHAVHLRLPAAFAEVIRASVQRLLPSAQ